MDIWITVIPILISIISLIFAIKANLRQVPKLTIKLIDEYLNPCYGATHISKENFLTHYVAYVNIRLSNKSLTPVTVSEINLKMGKDTFELAGCDVDFWKEICFYYEDDNEYTYNGSYIDYCKHGILPPFVINAYETKDIICVFMSFPKSKKPYYKAKINIETGAGVSSKTIQLIHYDKNLAKKEWENIDQYLKSI